MTQVSLFPSSDLGSPLAPKKSREPSGGDLRSAFILVGRFEGAMVMMIYSGDSVEMEERCSSSSREGESAAR